MTDKEFESLPVRVQEHIKRLAASNAAQQNGMYTGFYSPANVPSRFRRVGTYRHVLYPFATLMLSCSMIDWLRDKIYFERLVRKDQYVKNRLGFTAPNIYVMSLY